MSASGFARWVVVAGLVLAAGCKPKPSLPYAVACMVNDDTRVEGSQTVNVGMVVLAKTPGPKSPTGSVRLEVWERGPKPLRRCQLTGAVSASSYQAEGVAELKLPLSDDCLGAPAAGTHNEVRMFFTPALSGKVTQCDTQAWVTAAWTEAPKAQAARSASGAAGIDPRPVVQVDMKDALRLPNGKVDDAPNAIRIFVRVPSDWLAAGALTPQAKATLLAKMYGGPNWEQGNGDGSRYIVRAFASHVLTAAEVAAPAWATEPPKTSSWFYETMPDGSLDKRGPSFGPPSPITYGHLNDPSHVEQLDPR